MKLNSTMFDNKIMHQRSQRMRPCFHGELSDFIKMASRALSGPTPVSPNQSKITLLIKRILTEYRGTLLGQHAKKLQKT